MKCVSCGSKKLKAHGRNLDYIYSFNKGKWILSNPELGYYFSSENPFYISCISCQKFWKEKVLKNQRTGTTNHSEITLDLDHTLFFTEYGFHVLKDCDFSFLDESNKIYYSIFKRPGLDSFISFLKRNYKKINFYTSALDWYALKLIDSLNIEKELIGFIKTRKDTILDRSLSFDKEYMKLLDNSLVVEDKPLVISGYNNTIIKVKPYHNKIKDNELFRIKKLLNKRNKEIKVPKMISGEIHLYLKGMKIRFKNMPWNLFKKIIKIKSLSKEELEKQEILYNYQDPNFLYEYNKAKFNFVDISYKNYIKLYKIISPYALTKMISKDSFNNKIKNRLKKYRSMSNF